MTLRQLAAKLAEQAMTVSPDVRIAANLKEPRYGG